MDIERHIEFLLQNQAAHDAKIAILLQNQAAHDAQITEILKMQAKYQEMNQEMHAKTGRMLAEIVEGIDGLSRVAHMHEGRITRLEGPQ
jgi:hypothetical protein